MVRDEKGGYAKKVENPDCEPATKGYVKYIARKIGRHEHHCKTSSFITTTASGAVCIYGMFIGNIGVISAGVIGIIVSLDLIVASYSGKPVYYPYNKIKRHSTECDEECDE